MVGGLPKESTEDRYWDSMDGDELPRDPLSGSPGNPWYISPEGPRESEARPTSPAAGRAAAHTTGLLRDCGGRTVMLPRSGQV